MLVEAGEHHHVVLAQAKAAAGAHPGESGRLCDSFEGGGPSGSAGHVRRRVRQSPIGPRACSTHLRAVWARFLAEGWPWSRAQKPVGPRPSLARGRRPPHRRRELPGVCPTQTAPPRPARCSCVSGGRGARPPRWSPWGPRAAGGAWSGFGSCRAEPGLDPWDPVGGLCRPFWLRSHLPVRDGPAGRQETRAQGPGPHSAVPALRQGSCGRSPGTPAAKAPSRHER